MQGNDHPASGHPAKRAARFAARAISAALLGLSCMAWGPTAQAADAAYVTPQLLLSYAATGGTQAVIDFRPAIDAAASRIVFERQFPDKAGGYSSTVVLYTADLGGTAAPTPLYQSQQFPSGMPSTRADWCWPTDRTTVVGSIVFSISSDVPSNAGVFTIVPDGHSAPVHVSDNGNWIYPTWLPGCASLAVDATKYLKYGPSAPTDSNPGPSTLHIDLSGHEIGQNPLSGTRIWAGFPSFNPRRPNLLAIAAQQLVQSGYNENLNYVYIADTSATPPRVVPLDHRAPVNMYDGRFEGRAPTWSPDGRHIAFESNRNCADKTFYAIFVQGSAGRAAARQVTACGYNAQHAKWYPHPIRRRTLLVTTVRLNPNYYGTDILTYNARGIASLDVTRFVGD